MFINFLFLEFWVGLLVFAQHCCSLLHRCCFVTPPTPALGRPYAATSCLLQKAKWNAKRRRSNKIAAGGRVPVEQVYGTWKARFPYLRETMRLNIDKLCYCYHSNRPSP